MTTSFEEQAAISRLYFGKDDAESDIAEGGLLRQGFLQTTVYDTARSGRKTLVIGRKGSGKSAICMMLKRSSTQEEVVSIVTPDEISGDEVRRFELTGISREQSKALLWRYLLAVQVSKYVIAEAARNHGDDTPRSVRDVRKFLIDNDEIEDLTFQEKLWRVIERIKGSLSLEAFGVKVEAGFEPPSEGIRVSNEIETLERGLQTCFRDLACPKEHGNLLILIDQIEKIWSNDRDSDAMVVGLLIASKHVASIFERVRCVAFLRTDIYDLLQFQDRDKFRGDEAQIDWKASELLQLMLARAEASLELKLSLTDLLGEIFPEEVDGEDATEYIVNRTLMRPRDIIQLSNACRDTAFKNNHRRVTREDIREACTQYSNWKLLDLLGEYGVNYPFLKDLFVIFQSATYLLSRNYIEKRFDALHEGLVTRYPVFAHLFNLEGALNVLYSIGFLGVIRNHSSRFAYSDSKLIGADDNEFVIHPCFREALRSTSAIGIATFDRSIVASFENFGITVSSFERVRGSRGSRFRSYLVGTCLRLDEVITRSTLASDIKNEIHKNLLSILRELETNPRRDLYHDREMARKMYIHLRETYQRLGELELVDRNLSSAFRNVFDALAEGAETELRTELE